MQKFKLALCAAAMASAAPISAAGIIDGGFETQGAGSTMNYCYFAFSAGGNAPCAAGAWTGTGNSGIQFEANTPFPGTATLDGSYYGFVQNVGSFAQTFTADTTGSFILNFLEAGRPQNGGSSGNEIYNVTLNGNQIFAGTSTTGQAFTARASNPFSLIAGQGYTLSFNGTGLGPDDTAYIDAIAVAAVPEPATWAMMVLGFAVVGAGIRRRKALTPQDAYAVA